MIHALVRKLSNWPGIVALFVVNAACLVGFRYRAGVFKDIQLLDGDFGYGPEQARQLFASLANDHPDLLRWYGWSELTLDMVFPVVYTLLTAVLIGWLFRGKSPRWVLIPFAAGAADVLENLTIAYLALFNDSPAPYFLCAAAAAFSLAKWLLLGCVLATLAWGILLRLPGRPLGRS